jgi:RimJ/RimL family protein N-acetyltransferase
MGESLPIVPVPGWRAELPRLTAGRVTLREPAARDWRPLMDLLSVGDASRFGLEEISTFSLLTWIERAVRERQAGSSFAYVVTQDASDVPVGLVQVRRLDPAFEAAECEATLLPSARGTGVFLDAARLVERFAFGVVGIHRLEVRAPLHSGRAHAALRKIGAVEEGILRRSKREGSGYADQMLWSVLREDWTDSALPAQHVH